MGDRYRRREESAQLILEAAEALIRENGRDGLTMRRLADRADVAHVAAYQLFDSKSGVVRALARSSIAPALAGAVAADSTDDPIADAMARQHRLVDVLADDEAYRRELLAALDTSSDQAGRDAWLDLVSHEHRKLIDRLVESRLLEMDAPRDEIARHLLVAQDGAIRRWLRQLSTIEQLRTDMIAAVHISIRAFATREGSRRLRSAQALGIAEPGDR